MYSQFMSLQEKGERIVFHLLIFSLFLVIVNMLVFKTIVGIALIIGIILLLITLLRPKLIYLFLISLISIDGFQAFEGVSYAKFLGLILSVGLGLKLLMTKGTIPKDNSYKYFFLFFIGTLVSFAYAKNISVSMQIYTTFISLFFLYIFTRYFLKTEKDIHIALDFLFLATIVSFVYIKIKGMMIYNVESDVPRFAAGIGDSNEYACYIMVLLPLVVYRAMNNMGRLKYLYAACGIILFTILIYTGSRGGVLGFLGALVIFIQYYGMRKLKLILLILLVVAVSLYVFIPENYLERVATITAPEGIDSSKDARTENYRVALKMFLDRPLAGFGLNNFQFYSRDYGASRGMVVHNTYLEILTGGGLLSFIPFSLILMNTWKKTKIKTNYEKNTRDLMVCLKASFVSLLITTFFISEDHAKIYWFFLALTSSAFYIANYNKYDRTSI